MAARRLPHAALLLLAALLAGVTGFLTWPSRGLILCEQMPELAALAVCAATLFVVSCRALSGARQGRQDGRIAGGSAILAGLALFLSVHYVVQYRKPCIAVQHRVGHRAGAQ